jgi:hypothetical protein
VRFLGMLTAGSPEDPALPHFLASGGSEDFFVQAMTPPTTYNEMTRKFVRWSHGKGDGAFLLVSHHA